MEKSIPRTKSKINIYSWSFIVFIGLIFVMAIGVVTYFGLKTNKSELKISLTPQVIGKIKPADDLPSGTERQSIFTRTGKVVALEGTTLYLESIYTQDDKIMKAVFKARINSEATIIARDINELSRLGPQATEATGATPINLKDIQAGDTVTVLSGDNIKDKTEFSVQKVEKRYSS